MPTDIVFDLVARCYRDVNDTSNCATLKFAIKEVINMFWFKNLTFALPSEGLQTYISNQKFMQILHALLMNDKPISIQYDNKKKLKRLRLKICQNQCFVEIVEKSIVLLPRAFQIH